VAERKRERAQPFWAVPCPLLLSCLAQREAWPTTCAFGSWRVTTPASRDARGNVPTPASRDARGNVPTPASRDARGNVPTRIEAFPWCYIFLTLHFLKPYGLGTGTFVA
jgi:hypothetical protein